jgi:site-specific DNA-methyltransferase (adenine-specific)
MQEDLRVILVSDIAVKDRQRKDYGDMKDLDSMADPAIGLIHPIAVMEDGTGKYQLLAGGRRLAKANSLGWKDIKVNIYPQIKDELLLGTIELYENLHRKNLSYEEEVIAKKNLHDMYVKLYGKATPGPADKTYGWSYTDTAQILGEVRSTVANDIKLAEAIQAAPQLGKMKNKTKAWTAYNKLIDTKIKEELIKRQGFTVNKQQIVDGYIICDVVEGLLRLDDNSVDIIELDPPYNINLKSTTNRVMEEQLLLQGEHEMSEVQYFGWMQSIHQIASKKIKPSGWIITWLGPSWVRTIDGVLDSVNLVHPANPAVWTTTGGFTRLLDWHLRSCYEMFFYSRKSAQAKIAKIGTSNVFHIDDVPTNRRVHPCERPPELYQAVLETFGYTGQFVVAGFVGGGSILLAAANLRMKAIGFDRNDVYKKTFEWRVSSAEPGYYSRGTM